MLGFNYKGWLELVEVTAWVAFPTLPNTMVLIRWFYMEEK